MISNRKLFTLPLSFSFLSTPESIPGCNGEHAVLYSAELVDQLMTQSKVITDLNRFDLRFGKNGKRVEMGEYTNANDYLSLIQAAAKKEKLDLTLEQVKIIVGYCNSAYGKWVQQGITSLPFGTLNIVLLSPHGIIFGKEDMNLYHRITIKNKKIHLAHIFYANGTYLASENKKINYGRTLIKKKHEYVITEKGGFYDIRYINNKKSVLIDKEFYKNNLLPAVKNSFALKDDLEANEGNVTFDIFTYVPFLMDPEFAKIFFAKILQPLSSTNPNKSHLSVSQKIELAEKYISSCYDDYPKKKNKLLKQLYTEELKSLIIDDQYNLTQRAAAQNVLTQMNILPTYIQKKDSAILNDILKCTITGIRNPNDTDNIERFEEKAHEVSKTSWGKKLGCAMMVFLGVALLTASLILAVASFGASSVLSGAGIVIASNLLTHSLLITSSVVGTATATGGVAYAKYNPFKSFYRSTMAFWDSHAKKASEFSVTETKGEGDTCEEEEGLDRTLSCNA